MTSIKKKRKQESTKLMGDEGFDWISPTISEEHRKVVFQHFADGVTTPLNALLTSPESASVFSVGFLTPPCHILPPSEIPWRLFLTVLQAQKGSTYFTELAERVEYGNYVTCVISDLSSGPKCFVVLSSARMSWSDLLRGKARGGPTKTWLLSSL